MVLIFSKEEKDKMVVHYLDEQLNKGCSRGEAVRLTQMKFNIVHPQTVYNTEKRVKAKELEHDKREAKHQD